jgi:hypothetical protein
VVTWALLVVKCHLNRRLTCCAHHLQAPSAVQWGFIVSYQSLWSVNSRPVSTVKHICHARNSLDMSEGCCIHAKRTCKTHVCPTLTALKLSGRGADLVAALHALLPFERALRRIGPEQRPEAAPDAPVHASNLPAGLSGRPCNTTCTRGTSIRLEHNRATRGARGTLSTP